MNIASELESFIEGVNGFLNALGVGEISCFKNKCILSETRVMPQVIKPL